MSGDSARPSRPVRGKNGKAQEAEATSEVADSVLPEGEEFEPVIAKTMAEPDPEVLQSLPLATPAEQPVEEAPVEAEQQVVNPIPQPTNRAPEPVAKEVNEEPEPVDDLPPLNGDTEAKTTKKKFRLPSKGKKNGGGDSKDKKRRHNPRRKSLVITGSVLGGIAVVIGFSLYKVGQAPSTNDMVMVYQAQTGDYGFPVARGKQAATEFLTLYLSAPEDSDLRATQKKQLENLLSGTASAPSWPNNVTQRILYGPEPFGLMVQENGRQANQRYLATVETTTRVPQDGRDFNGDPYPDLVTTEVTRVAYRVDLQQSPDGAKVFVVGNPTLIPTPVLKATDKTLDSPPLTDNKLGTEINQSLMEPFFKAWGASDAPSINALLASDVEAEWVIGLDGQQTFVGSTTSAPSGLSASGEGPAEVLVTWRSPQGETQVSAYTVNVVFQNSRWLVQNIT